MIADQSSTLHPDTGMRPSILLPVPHHFSSSVYNRGEPLSSRQTDFFPIGTKIPNVFLSPRPRRPPFAPNPAEELIPHQS